MSEILTLLQGMHKEAKTEWQSLKVQQATLEGSLSKVWMPKGADAEYNDLMRKARSPWLRYAAECFTNALIIDGYSDARAWSDAWERSGFSGKQHAVNFEAVAYGYSYILTFPANDGSVLLRHLPIAQTYAVKADPWDDQPSFVLHKINDKFWRAFDDTAMYEVRGSLEHGEVTATPHGLGRCPVSIIQAHPQGESVVSIGQQAYKRTVDSVFTLQMVQRYGAFPQKYQSGGEILTDDEGNALIQPSADSLIYASDAETRFGSFASADINQVVNAVDSSVSQLAAMLAIPPHYLLGKVVNLSSEALAATETGFIRKLGMIQESLGEGYEQALRNASAFLGDLEASRDYASEVHWKDVTVRTLASAADAIQKLSSLGAPTEQLFLMVPGWTKQDALNAARTPETADPTALAVTPTEDDEPSLKERSDSLGTLIRAGVTPASASEITGIQGAKFTGATPVALRPPGAES